MKTFKRLLTITLLALFSIAISACGKKNKKTTGGNKTKTQVVTHEVAKKGIGPDGGSVADKDNNVKLVIPKGALSANTEISAKYVSNQVEFGTESQLNFIGGAEFGPSGTTFDKEVEVTLNLSENPNTSSIAIFCFDETNKCWNYVTDASVSGSKATFSITHFSRYEALNLTPEMFNKYESLVKTAKSKGYDDSWITSSYYDYLVNEKHVMDYYERYDGYYYEACYLNIMGDYFLSGDEGDPEALWKETGESNKVGNKYGLSKIGSMTSSYEEYKKEKNKPASERKDIIYVSVIIEYKLIEPQIDATPGKTDLAKGETDTIQVHCHYVNPSNFFYPDFDMDDYPLTVTVNNLTTDKSSLFTNSTGRDSFNVTSTSDENKTVKIQFYVAGAWGGYSSAYVNYGSVDFNISGHVKETIEFEFKLKESGGYIATDVNGLFKLTVEYDVSGYVKSGENGLNGEINISNVTASLESRGNQCHYTMDASGSVNYHIFEKVTSKTPYSPSYNVSGTISNGICTLTNKGSESKILYMVGSGAAYVTVESHNTSEPDAFKISISDADSLLLGFALEEGVQSNSSTFFKDDFSMKFDYMDTYDVDYSFWNMDNINYKETTTQTITLTKNTTD